MQIKLCINSIYTTTTRYKPQVTGLTLYIYTKYNENKVQKNNKSLGNSALNDLSKN